jgi:hypothetical protein
VDQRDADDEISDGFLVDIGDAAAEWESGAFILTTLGRKW